ncbi:MAG: TAT-variant-translocated molybdopterin oxidoreductase [Leptonema sp. (in: Bacteria)]|nr:TAT-variant-translocated molybdopterin oxidoreductase [Leptonema sp. (in: bacteria)]
MSETKKAVESRRKYWQSLEERVLPPTEDWITPEFETSRNEMADAAATTKFSRKDFMKIMGAGAVMLQAACRRPTEQIVPAVISAPEYTPGEKLYYSSVTKEGTGIIIHSREGRPIKIAGNPDHPITHGGVTASEVASLMDLYDPDRLRYPVSIKNGKKQKATESQVIKDTQKAVKDGNYVLLTGPINSPSSKALIEDFLKAIRAVVI